MAAWSWRDSERTGMERKHGSGWLWAAAALAGGLLGAAQAFGQDAATAGVPAAKLDTGDAAWMLASTLLVPLVGVTATCLATAGLNALAGVVMLARK